MRVVSSWQFLQISEPAKISWRQAKGLNSKKTDCSMSSCNLLAICVKRSGLQDTGLILSTLALAYLCLHWAATSTQCNYCSLIFWKDCWSQRSNNAWTLKYFVNYQGILRGRWNGMLLVVQSIQRRVLQDLDTPTLVRYKAKCRGDYRHFHLLCSVVLLLRISIWTNFFFPKCVTGGAPFIQLLFSHTHHGILFWI